jgi:alcohol dehydrogenase (cytochrome c)
MYVTLPRAGVKALDLRTGRQLWSYEHSLSPGVRFSSMANRGAALLDGRLFFGTLDAYLLALDATSGERLWKTKVADHQIGYSITSAPLALKDKIVTGISGGEFGVRGFLDAYDPETGKRLWRFWTIPEPGEPGHETWQGEAWKTGGGPTWITGSYDPEANLILWGTGNPSPLFNGDVRPGDNLYTDSLVALDADTGELRWHFQFTPHDQLDLDAAQIPVLVDRTFGGALRKLVLFANRNGFFYVFDRLTGEYLLGKQYGPQTWAKGLDEKGRPIPLPQGQPSTEGARIVPASGGITNWNSPSYSPQTGLLYVAMREDHATYIKQSDPKYSPGVVYPGGATVEPPESEKRGAIIALSPETGDIVWRTNLQSAPWGGVHATAGGLVFGGTSDGWAFAPTPASRPGCLPSPPTWRAIRFVGAAGIPMFRWMRNWTPPINR